MNSYRIGQVVPSSNTTMETEIPRMLLAREKLGRERFTFHSSRMRMHRVTPEELAKMNQENGRCAAELADARVDVMSTACLVAIMASGPGYHRKVEEEMRAAAQAAGATSKVMTSAGALIDGLKALNAKRVALLCPYMKPLAKLVVDYIEGEGIAVKDYRAFEIPDNLKVGQVEGSRLLEEAKTLDTRDVDAVVLSACVQMPSLASIEAAQKMIGLPVTSTAVCTAWKMLVTLGIEPRVEGAGALLAGEAAYLSA
jgi:maleate isomerase